MTDQAPSSQAPDRGPGARRRRLIAGSCLGVVAIGCALSAARQALVQGWKRGGEAPPIGALKTLSSAQTLFRDGDGDGDGTLDYARSLAELSDAGLIDDELGEGVKYGYAFRIVPSAAHGQFVWAATAEPFSPATGGRWFATNHAGVIYYTTSGPIAPDPFTCAMPAGVLPVGK